MIVQSAFFVKSTLGSFIGIVAYNDDSGITSLQAAKQCWGTESAYTELSWNELARPALRGLQDQQIFTCSVNP